MISGTKVQILPNGPVPTNKKLCGLAEKIKPYIMELIDHANVVCKYRTKTKLGIFSIHVHFTNTWLMSKIFVDLYHS